MTVGGSNQLFSGRQESFAVLFDLLRTLPETTRTDLARRSGLSKATVSEAIGLLLAHDFVREVGKRQPGRGRSQVVLEFRPAARYVIGVQFSESGCRAVLADLRAQPRHRSFRPIAGAEPEHFVESVCACVEELLPYADAPLIGLGVGVPGTVDPSARFVSVSVPYGWRDVPIADLLETRLGLPVLAANRAKAAALGEMWQGEHPGVDHLVYIFLGGGIVAGIIANGRLYFGSLGAAGELGHVTVLPDGPACGCGNHGCLHALASVSAIIRAVRTRARHDPHPTPLTELTGNLLGHVSLDTLIEAARRGDRIVLETIAEVGAYLGLAIANLINLINPQRIVIGGPVAGFGEPLLDAIRQEIRRRALWDSLVGVAIVPSQLGEEAGTIGAAALFLESIDPGSLVLGSKDYHPTFVADG